MAREQCAVGVINGCISQTAREDNEVIFIRSDFKNFIFFEEMRTNFVKNFSSNRVGWKSLR